MHHIDLDTITLKRGSHPEGSGEYCLVEAAVALAGGPWGDKWDESISPVIGAFCRRWQDDLGDDERQMLKPYAWKIIGTATGAADDERRSWLVTDWMVRTYLPVWLRLAELETQAATVESLPDLVDPAAWDTMRETVGRVLQ